MHTLLVVTRNIMFYLSTHVHAPTVYAPSCLSVTHSFWKLKNCIVFYDGAAMGSCHFVIPTHSPITNIDTHVSTFSTFA